MKIAIVYASTHHGNTRRLATAIARSGQVTLIDAMQNPDADLSPYELIGFASGIAFGKYYPQLMEFARRHLPENRKVFALHTAGSPRAGYAKELLSLVGERHCDCLGVYQCKGFDTFGPFKVLGASTSSILQRKRSRGQLPSFTTSSRNVNEIQTICPSRQKSVCGVWGLYP